MIIRNIACVSSALTFKAMQGATTQTHRVDGIYLRPVNSLQGGHEVMSLATGKRIICTRVVPCSIKGGGSKDGGGYGKRSRN